MYISRPNYSVEELVLQFEKKEDMPLVEKSISSCILNILKESDKFLISELYPFYVEEFEKEENIEKDSSGSSSSGKVKLEPYKENITFEYFDSFLNKEVLINILGVCNPLYLKLLTILGKKHNADEKGYMIIYFFKQNNDWGMPVETIIIDEKFKKTIIQIFPQKSFSMKNNMYSEDQQNSLQSFINGLFSIFSSLMGIFKNKNIEYINVNPLKPNKNNKKCYSYKVPHIFLNPPINNLKTNQALTMSIQHKNKLFDKNIKNIKDKLYFS